MAPSEHNISAISNVEKYCLSASIRCFESSLGNFNTLNQLYKVFVISHLDYSDVIYHISPVSNLNVVEMSLSILMEKLERIQEGKPKGEMK